MKEEKGFRITRRSLAAIRPEDGSVRGTAFTDTELSGFFISVYSSGSVSFNVRYRANGQRRILKIGDYPAMSPETARIEAARILSAASCGTDEAEKRKAAREAAEGKAKRITFAEFAKQHVQDVARRHLKSASEVERYVTMTTVAWGPRVLEEISTRDAEALRNQIALRGSTTANRWYVSIAAAFSSAVRLGHAQVNPFKNLKKLPENPPRQRTMTADEEASLRAVVGSWVNAWEKTAFTILVDCGARVGEVLAAKWADLDLDAKGSGVLRLPNPKSGVPQSIPILPHVGKVIAATPKIEDCPYIVPGRVTAVKRHDLRGPWLQIKAAAKLGDDLRLHDLRRSFGLRITRSMGLLAASKLLRHGGIAITERIYAPLSAVDLVGFAEGAERARVKGKAKVLQFKKSA